MRTLIRQVIAILDGAPTADSNRDRRRGQSLVEMVFITPILIIMFVGMVEIGWFAQNYLNLIEAAKVGARRGPFLNGEFSPPLWNEDASLAPIGALGYNPLDPDHEPRATYRGLDEFGVQDCNNIPENSFGFFNVIACTVAHSMDPLRINFGNNKDDVVVSAFSVQRVNIGPNAINDIDTGAAVPPASAPSSTPYDDGTQLVVVGRWPSNANECYLWNERDPFDWIEDGELNWSYVPDPITPSINVRLNYEMGVWDEIDGVYAGWLDSGQEKQVGFSWTGQRQIENGADERIDCYGSSFTSDDVQRLVNLPNFIPGGSPNEEERKQYLPNTGVVIVEIFWEHSLLLESFPLLSATWSPVYHAMGGDDPNSTADVIYAWAAFPVPSAEPRLAFKP